MSAKSASQVRAVTEQVIDEFTAGGMMFTALDVSNVVKRSLPDVRHREIAPLVRALFERRAMGAYVRSNIDVVAEGGAKVQALLYHLPRQALSLYDDAMRAQLAVPPGFLRPAAEQEKGVTFSTTEQRVRVGRDGRGRIARQLLENAGITGESVLIASSTVPPKLEISRDSAGAAGPVDAASLAYPAATRRQVGFDHPTELHLASELIELFGADTRLVARIHGPLVIVVPELQTA